MCSDFLSYKQWTFYNELISGLHNISFVCKIPGDELRRSKDLLLVSNLTRQRQPSWKSWEVFHTAYRSTTNDKLK
jgi:hypothetical protein